MYPLATILKSTLTADYINIKKGIYFIVISLILSSCAAVGTRTLYKTNEGFQIEKIGFNKLDKDTILSKIFPQTDKIFTLTVFETFNEYGISSSKDFKTDLSFDNPDLTKISEICKEYDLDGLIITKLKFIHVTYTMYFVPIAQNYDTEVEMKLFDQNGKLLIGTKHNTLNGNSYMMPPTADKTIHDGTKGALKRIVKEMGLKKTR
jgi:hypothetical protein